MCDKYLIAISLKKWAKGMFTMPKLIERTAQNLQYLLISDACLRNQGCYRLKDIKSLCISTKVIIDFC